MHVPRFLRIALPLLGAALSLRAAAGDEWIPFGQSATVRKSGKTAILEYKVVPGQIGMALLPVSDSKLAGMTHLRFRLKTDVSTVVGVLLSEKKPDGGDYTATFWSPKDQWQQIDLTPVDFAINDGPKDPKDADGRLDVDQVQAVGIVDVGQLFNQAPADSKMPIAVTRLTGDHKLAIEDFEIVTAAARPQQGKAIDDFHRDFLAWFTPGGGDLSLSKSGNPLGKPALQFSYHQAPAEFSVVMHSLGSIDLRSAKELDFDISSTEEAQVVIALEEQKVDGRPGPRYNHFFTVSAGQTGHMSIPFSEFNLAEDSPPDPADHLDLSKVRSIALIDFSGALNGNTGKNTIWVADMKAQ